MKINFRVILFIILFCFSSYSILNNNSEKKYIISENEDSYETNYNQTDEEEYSLEKSNLENDYTENIKNTENKNIANEITVFISGEVNNPGIITIESGKRLYDALEKLGGTTENADLNRVNLAVKLEDESHYVVPKIGEEIDYNISENNIDLDTKSNENTESKKININTASIEELDSLPGIGEATANKIISYREENGSFNSVDELKNVNGIGDKKYEDLKEFIYIK